MTFWRNLLFSVCAILVSFQLAVAQSGWNINRSKGTGDLVAVFFVSSDKGWVAGDEGYLAVTYDGGRNWTRQILDLRENINEIYFRSDDNGYLVAGKKVYITDNGGRDWRATQIYNPGDFRGLTPEFLSVRFTDKKRGWIVGSVLNSADRVVDSLVMKTEDGGESWTRVKVPTKSELFHLDFNGNSHGWIVGNQGTILHTANGGEVWQLQRSGTDRAIYNVDFRDDDEGYAVGGKGTILRTENGGEIWETVTTNFPTTFMRVDFADDKNGWVVGYNGTILRSNDKGKTWVKQESRTGAHLFGLFTVKKYGWAVGAGGVVVEYQR